jgi:hypothetical protein
VTLHDSSEEFASQHADFARQQRSFARQHDEQTRFSRNAAKDHHKKVNQTLWWSF